MADENTQISRESTVLDIIDRALAVCAVPAVFAAEEQQRVEREVIINIDDEILIDEDDFGGLEGGSEEAGEERESIQFPKKRKEEEVGEVVEAIYYRRLAIWHPLQVT
jgi:hypothetical protein